MSMTSYPYAQRSHPASSSMSMSNGANQSSAQRKQKMAPFPNANSAGDNAMPGMYHYYNHNHHHRLQPPSTTPSAPRSQTKTNPPFLRSRASTESPSESMTSVSTTPRRSASSTTLNPPFPSMAELPDLGVIDLSDGRNAERPQSFKATIFFPGAKSRRGSSNSSTSQSGTESK
ncbi:hypothetical protein FRC03_010244 [Tulasnella sp. 419]|nr:hypothetical protein FRC03_010244 [Tulasnella sp. 419]